MRGLLFASFGCSINAPSIRPLVIGNPLSMEMISRHVISPQEIHPSEENIFRFVDVFLFCDSRLAHRGCNEQPLCQFYEVGLSITARNARSISHNLSSVEETRSREMRSIIPPRR